MRPEHELTLKACHSSSRSGSSPRSETTQSDVSSCSSSPVSATSFAHVLISHRISLHVILSGNDWIHRASQASQICFQLPPQPLQVAENLVEEPHSSYTVSSAHLLDSPTFLIIPSGFSYSEPFATTFELYTAENARLCCSELHVVSHETPHLASVIPQHIWTSLVECPRQ